MRTWLLGAAGVRRAAAACRRGGKLEVAVACRRGAANGCTTMARNVAIAVSRQAMITGAAAEPSAAQRPCHSIQDACDAYLAATSFKVRYSHVLFPLVDGWHACRSNLFPLDGKRAMRGAWSC